MILIRHSRRYFMLVLGSAVLAARARSSPKDENADTPSLNFSAIEARLGGRVGVAALDTGTGKRVGYRAASFGPIGAAFGIGFVLGPALGGLLGSISPRLPGCPSRRRPSWVSL